MDITINNYGKIDFGSRRQITREAAKGMKKVLIKGEASKIYSRVFKLLGELHPKLRKISSESATEELKQLFTELQTKLGLKSVSKNLKDGIVF